MEVRIVHLSDVHLADDFILRSIKRRRRWWKTEDRTILHALADTLREVDPHYVVISGDIVNKCSSRTFSSAAQTLKELFQRAGIDIRSKVLIVPGNHDVYVFPEQDEYFGRLREFIRFLKTFFGEDDYRSRTERFTVLDPVRKVCFFALDSTLKFEQPIAEGKIGVAQLAWLQKKNATFAATHADWNQYLKIAILHHHPHPIAAGGGERFMQLLDAGDTIRAFEGIGINLVLHGHKHFPHVLPHFHPNGHYTVVGAGTACCPFVEEQSGTGNNFNVIRLDAPSNVLRVTRYTADNNQVFIPEPAVPAWPLLPPSPRGYRIHEYHFQASVLDHEGTCAIIDKRIGLIADSNSGEGLRQIAFLLGGFPDGSEIVEFRPDDKTIASVSYERNLPGERAGSFVLKQPLKWGGERLDLEYRARVTRAFQMRAPADGTPAHESVEVTMIHHCDIVRVTAQLPMGFAVTPQVRIRDENYSEIDPKKVAFDLTYDDGTNRHTLVVTAPRLGYEYSLRWRVP